MEVKEKLKKVGSGTFYDIPSTLKQNATNFGIGEKKASYIMDPKTPGPVHYEIKRIYEHVGNVQKMQSERDCTFGLPHRYFNNNVLVIGETSPQRPQTSLSSAQKPCREPPLYAFQTLGKDSPGHIY